MTAHRRGVRLVSVSYFGVLAFTSTAIVPICGAFNADEAAPNTLTDKERAGGWKLIFDGRTTRGWRGVMKDKAPDGWQAVEGALVRVAAGGDIITEEQFENFELAFDWKVADGANSGVFFRVNEEWGVIQSPEYQILHNQKHPDGRNTLTAAASNYALHAPAKDLTRPVGQWNQGKIVANGSHVEHWLNGEKVVDYELGSDEWAALVRKSKFSSMGHYGQSRKGHIALQDHGDHVAYRNMKIRVLTATK